MLSFKSSCTCGKNHYSQLFTVIFTGDLSLLCDLPAELFVQALPFLLLGYTHPFSADQRERAEFGVSVSFHQTLGETLKWSFVGREEW